MSNEFFSKSSMLSECKELIEKGEIFFKDELGDFINCLRSVWEAIDKYGKCMNRIDVKVNRSEIEVYLNNEVYTDTIGNIEEDKKDIPAMIYLLSVGKALNALAVTETEQSVTEAFAALYCISAYFGRWFSKDKTFKEMYSAFMAYKSYYESSIIELSYEDKVKKEILKMMSTICECTVAIANGYYKDDSKLSRYIREKSSIIHFISDIFDSFKYKFDVNEVKTLLSTTKYGELTGRILFDEIEDVSNEETLSEAEDTLPSDVITDPASESNEYSDHSEPAGSSVSDIQSETDTVVVHETARVAAEVQAEPEHLISILNEDKTTSDFSDVYSSRSISETGVSGDMRKVMSGVLDKMISSSSLLSNEEVASIVGEYFDTPGFKMPGKQSGQRDLTFILAYDFWDKLIKELGASEKFAILYQEKNEAAVVAAARFILFGKQMIFTSSGYRKLIVRKDDHCLLKIEMRDVFIIFTYVLGKYLGYDMSEENTETSLLSDNSAGDFINGNINRINCCIFLTELLKCMVFQSHSSSSDLSKNRDMLYSEVCESFINEIYSVMGDNAYKTAEKFGLNELYDD